MEIRKLERIARAMAKEKLRQEAKITIFRRLNWFPAIRNTVRILNY